MHEGARTEESEGKVEKHEVRLMSLGRDQVLRQVLFCHHKVFLT